MFSQANPVSIAPVPLQKKQMTFFISGNNLSDTHRLIIVTGFVYRDNHRS